MKYLITPAIALYVFLCCTSVIAEPQPTREIDAAVNLEETAGEAEDVAAADEEITGWPLEFIADEAEVIVYQPQFDEWRDFSTLTGKAAFSVQLDDSEEPLYGALYFEADTDVDKARDEVLLDGIKISKIHIADIDAAVADKAENVARNMIQDEGAVIISLESLVADLEADSQDIREVDINLEPPPIIYSDQPAIMLGFLGEPSFKPVEGANDLMFAVNTNWDLLLDLPSSTYYLLSGDNWMETHDPLQGPWKSADALPDSLKRLPDEEWADVKEHIPGESADRVPLVFVATEPSELIVTDGEPEYGLISGTRLMYVTNTDSDLFLDTLDKKFYFLTAGRWFRAERLQGPWSAASADLPDEFRKIPDDHDTSAVLISVPGTADAEAAALLASVPQKATVSRKQTTTEVVYDGEPEFIEIRGTSPIVSYAINSPNDVFLASGLYYALVDGIWFVAGTPLGPWAVAEKVDQAIYSIPEDSPKHNATYVRVYESTPDNVVVGYTSGYSGSYVAATGVLMFGLGLLAGNHWKDHRYRHYHDHYHGYGTGARYRFGRGYARDAGPLLYGPHAGISGRVAYDPISRRYHRGRFMRDAHSSDFSHRVHGPFSDRYRTHTIISTPYDSWGGKVVTKGEKWKKADHHKRSQRGSHVGKRSSHQQRAERAGREAGKRFKSSRKRDDSNLFVGKNDQIYKIDRDGVSKHVPREGWKKSKDQLDRKEQKTLKNRNKRSHKERRRKAANKKSRSAGKFDKAAAKAASERTGKNAAGKARNKRAVRNDRDNSRQQRKTEKNPEKSRQNRNKTQPGVKQQQRHQGKKPAAKVESKPAAKNGRDKSRQQHKQGKAAPSTQKNHKKPAATTTKQRKSEKSAAKSRQNRQAKRPASREVKQHNKSRAANKPPQHSPRTKAKRSAEGGKANRHANKQNATKTARQQSSKKGASKTKEKSNKSGEKCGKNDKNCKKQ
jgi:hypothetical protein